LGFGLALPSGSLLTVASASPPGDVGAYCGVALKVSKDTRPGKTLVFGLGAECELTPSQTNVTGLSGGGSFSLIYDEEGRLLHTEFVPRVALKRGLVDVRYEPGIRIRFYDLDSDETEAPHPKSDPQGTPGYRITLIRDDAWQPRIKGVTPSEAVSKVDELKQALRESSSPSEISQLKEQIRQIETWMGSIQSGKGTNCPVKIPNYQLQLKPIPEGRIDSFRTHQNAPTVRILDERPLRLEFAPSRVKMPRFSSLPRECKTPLPAEPEKDETESEDPASTFPEPDPGLTFDR